ncbi:MAG: hypothetical protein H0T05_03955 [Acidobacteria bacterium]|nr:hypothetical protein [Acidobacteriota bacterium]MBA3886321.1 hypothetical protein [Acidobacteriota bacterium]
MRKMLVMAAAIALLVPVVPSAQDQDADRKVAGGGIKAAGWQGRIDPAAAKKGSTINDSKFEQQGDALHLSVGPAAIYWNPKHTASGDYTVKATFREAKPDTSHPHPYGVFIGGHNLDTPDLSLVYCIAYSDGTFLVRGFNGPSVVQVGKRQPHAAVQKPGTDGSVTNEVAWNVRGGRAECAINGTTVASYERAELVAPGRLESTDGLAGIRVSHNVDAVVTGFGISK